MATVAEAKSLICNLCCNFYQQGWVSGTGGGMSIKVGDKIVMAPSGVQKERMREDDMFILDEAGSAYELRGAGAVLHSHSINAVLATLLQPEIRGKSGLSEFRATNLEMIKGITGHGYYDDCVVPIINNTARECELTESLRDAIKKYPKANAVLVKRHGVYVWGDNWIHAKTQAECYEYLFNAAVRLKALNVDVSVAPAKSLANGSLNGHVDEQPQAKKQKLTQDALPVALVLDIEGTIAPIAFVKETLFPYARQHLEEHLRRTFGSAETRADIALLQKEAVSAMDKAAVSHQPELATVLLGSKEAAIRAVVSYVETLMAEDKKSTGLKALQGHVLREGFKSGKLKSEFYDDFLEELPKWRQQGLKVYIYSSGSREAQRNLFACSATGDLREHICGFFDTTIGAKVDTSSYQEIFETIGVDSASQVLFATDAIKEAEAAEAAGWQVVLALRAGNPAVPLTSLQHFRTVSSMTDLLVHH